MDKNMQSLQYGPSYIIEWDTKQDSTCLWGSDNVTGLEELVYSLLKSGISPISLYYHRRLIKSFTLDLLNDSIIASNRELESIYLTFSIT